MVEGNGLENRRAGNGTQGSNPCLSAKLKSPLLVGFLVYECFCDTPTTAIGKLNHICFLAPLFMYNSFIYNTAYE